MSGLQDSIYAAGLTPLFQRARAALQLKRNRRRGFGVPEEGKASGPGALDAERDISVGIWVRAPRFLNQVGVIVHGVMLKGSGFRIMNRAWQGG